VITIQSSKKTSTTNSSKKVGLTTTVKQEKNCLKNNKFRSLADISDSDDENIDDISLLV
jgi:hypothetical protein